MNLERNRAERRNKKKVSILYRGIPYLIFAALAAGYLAGVPGAAATAAIMQASHMTATFVSRRELFVPFGAGLIGRTNASAAAQDKLPTFTYTGTYTLLDDGDGNWRIKFLTSGTLVMQKSVTIDVFLVGGGGGGGNSVSYNSAGGGGGGYTNTHAGIVLTGGTSYSVVVGAGGGSASSGGTTWFAYSNLYYAAGGNGGGYPGGSGGNGGGGGGGQTGGPGNGGTNGANGTSGYYSGGSGQGTSTREFGEASGDLYAGGGRGAGRGGAFGSYGTGYYGRGGSGVAEQGNGESGIAGIGIIRNHRAA